MSSMPDTQPRFVRIILWRDWIPLYLDDFRKRLNYSPLEIDADFIDSIAAELETNGIKDNIENVAKLICRILESKSAVVRVARDEALSKPGFMPDVYLSDPKYAQADNRFAAHLGLAIMRIDDPKHQVLLEFADWLRQEKRTEKDVVHRLREL